MWDSNLIWWSHCFFMSLKKWKENETDFLHVLWTTACLFVWDSESTLTMIVTLRVAMATTDLPWWFTHSLLDYHRLHKRWACQTLNQSQSPLCLMGINFMTYLQVACSLLKWTCEWITYCHITHWIIYIQ